MPGRRNRQHILVTKIPVAEDYTPHGRRIEAVVPPAPADRHGHAVALTAALQQAEQDAAQRRGTIGIVVEGANPGLYIEFDSVTNVPLKLESLENKRLGIELVAVRQVPSGVEGESLQKATVFVPDGALKHFVKRFGEYATQKTAQKGEPKHKDMVDRIAALRLATLKALWTDSNSQYPADDVSIWWEVWLRRQDGSELERFLQLAGVANFAVGGRRLEFDDRIVLLARATPEQLASSLDVLSDLAEVRMAKRGAAPFADASAENQAEAANALVARTAVPGEAPVAVCVLDTGVNRAHPLLSTSLSAADTLAVDPAWGPHDDGGGPDMMGHGTEMAGLALYGDLAPVLNSDAPLQLAHRLESVKILPPTGANDPELYGAITAEATSRIEIQAPQRRRAFSLAVTAPDQGDRGEPTSWSSAIDALAAGRSFDPTRQGLVYLDNAEDSARRLFVISAGNVSQLEADHLVRSDLESVHDPGQAWNALTVGACTDKSVVDDPDWEDWKALAPLGELSPWSTTSVSFARTWPIKPDVVFEGGNVVANGDAEVDFPVPDLCLLSTYFKPADKAFVLSWATSAATAQVARMAALVSAEYPDLWPETVRALIVHSAEWTRTMSAHLKGAGGKRARAALVRRYGFGVPDVIRATKSANDALTLVAQSRIRPYVDGKMREMHIHELPWPRAVLEELAQTPVRLRVTLSYFIEPNPSRRGWIRRYRYPSHGLRFEVKAPEESMDEFRKRINERALEEDEHKPTAGDASDWFLGEQARNTGSLHSDFLAGTAADLAARGVIAVYPVSGWWKDQPKRDRSSLGARYALIVSIETDAADVDIWTPVALEVGIAVEVPAQPEA